MSNYAHGVVHTEQIALDAQIEALKAEIAKQMETVRRLKAEEHETADATRHLDNLLQQYSALTQLRYMP
jgi:hypothetical protein